MRKLASLLFAGALTLGILGSGVGASYLDSATAALNINAGTFSCQVSSTDPHAVVTGNSVTVNLPDILSSASSNYLFDVSVKNTGSMTQVVHWSAATAGSITWQPAGRMGYAMGTSGDPMTAALTLAPGATHTYAGAIGYMWAELTNADFGKSAQVTYTATCGEVPPPAASKISFVGVVNQAGHAALALPAGATTGDLVVVEAEGSSAPGVPTGYTSVTTTVAPRTSLSYHVLTAGETTVPAGGTNMLYEEVAVYRGAAGIGAFTYNSGNVNNIGLSGGLSTYYPAHCVSLSLTKTDSSSWVACMSFDGYASTNMKSVNFQVQTAAGPPVVVGATVAGNRSSALSDAHTGLADTGAGVANWSGTYDWTSPGDNFPLPGTHGVTVYSIELLSK